jgi:hypothetical protein
VTNEDRTREQLDKLAGLEKHAQELVGRPHYHLHDGQPVLDPASGEPLRDDEPTLRGLDVLLGVHKLRAQILGLYAPERHEYHLVDEGGNTLDITRLVPILRRLGLATDAD